MSTYAIIRNGRNVDMGRYVERVFKSEDTANRYVNSLDYNVTLVEIPGKHRVGDRIDWTTKVRSI